MILWLVLFLIIITVSFILAFQSMRDFVERPVNTGEEYGLFLIRSPDGLTVELLNSLHSQLVKKSRIISLEKLFKGRKSALVVFGPKKVLMPFGQNLNLLELEDYTKINNGHFHIWEMGLKRFSKSFNGQVLTNMPAFKEDEQFWWQLVLQNAHRGPKKFAGQIRAVLSSSDPVRLKDLFQTLSERGDLVKVPQAITSAQELAHFKERAIQPGATHLVSLNPEEIVPLLLHGSTSSASSVSST